MKTAVLNKKHFIKRVIALVLTSCLIVAGSTFGSAQANQVIPFPTAFQNGSFEDGMAAIFTPVPAANARSKPIDQGSVPGWNTTEADGLIEIWLSGFTPGSAVSTGYRYNTAAGAGDYLAELNANWGAMLYQSIETTPGALYRWSALHRGRMSNTVPDKADVLIGAYEKFDLTLVNDPAGSPLVPPTTPPVSNNDMSRMEMSDIAGTVNEGAGVASTQWGSYYGYYPADSDHTLMGFVAISSTGTNNSKVNSMGNLIDNASWQEISEPATETVVSGDTPDDSLMVNNLADGYSASPDYSSIPTDANGDLQPGVYQVPVIIKQGGNLLQDSNKGTLTATESSEITSTLIVRPKLTVKFVDEDTGSEIQTSTVTPGWAEESWDASSVPDSITTADGVTYLFDKRDESTDTTTGVYGITTLGSDDAPLLRNTNVTYLYKRATLKITVHYVDDQGNTLAPDETTKTASGLHYDIGPPSPGDKVTFNGVVYIYDDATGDETSGTAHATDLDITLRFHRWPGIDFSFNKVGDHDAPLWGVAFKLTPRNAQDTAWDSAEATTVVSGSDGTVTLTGLLDTRYLLEEVDPYPGYGLPLGYWVLTVNAEATPPDPVVSIEAKGTPPAFRIQDGVYTLVNYKNWTLPFLGSWGVIPYVIAGVILLGAALIPLPKSKKKTR